LFDLKRISFTYKDKEVLMERKTVVGIMLVALLTILTGCATMESAGHKIVMRGQILDVTDGTAYLCIGSGDGAEVGQQLTVYKFEKSVNTNPKFAGQPYFARTRTGRIQVTQIVDEHMATAKILSGQVKVNDVAELD
jgi:hypothetical protein